MIRSSPRPRALRPIRSPAGRSARMRASLPHAPPLCSRRIHRPFGQPHWRPHWCEHARVGQRRNSGSAPTAPPSGGAPTEQKAIFEADAEKNGQMDMNVDQTSAPVADGTEKQEGEGESKPTVEELKKMSDFTSPSTSGHISDAAFQLPHSLVDVYKNIGTRVLRCVEAYSAGTLKQLISIDLVAQTRTIVAPVLEKPLPGMRFLAFLLLANFVQFNRTPRNMQSQRVWVTVARAFSARSYPDASVLVRQLRADVRRKFIRSYRHKNTLKNAGTMVERNPYTLTMRRALRQEVRAGKCAEI
eukprot:285062_1